MIPDSKTCVYCGKPGGSKEHIWGKWSREHALFRTERSAHALVRFLDGTRTGPTVELKGALERPGSTRSQSLRIVCESCNNGWMSMIVEAARPVLTRMNYGYWGRVTTGEAAALSRWIAMFTMSFEFADRETVCVPQHVREEFARGDDLGPDWLIAIGFATPRTGLEPAAHRAFRLSIESGHEAMIQCTVFLCGRLICMSNHSVAGCPERLHRMAEDMKLCVIHPPGAEIIKPLWEHDESSVDMIIQSMSDAISWRNDSSERRADLRDSSQGLVS